MAKKNINAQLALMLQPTHDHTFDSFTWGENHLLQRQLMTIGTGNSPDLFFYLWGEAGVGKSHLLQACCLQLQLSQAAMYLPLKVLKSYGPDILEGMETQSLIALDDLDSIAGDAAWEEAIFCLMNTIRQAGRQYLIMSSTVAPVHSPLHLPDLKSRLHWALATQVLPLNDEQKILTLQRYTLQRGFALPYRVAQFLMTHFDRQMHHLVALLDELDKSSLAAQRKITIPFVKEILGNG